jgi:hypothetical protein
VIVLPLLLADAQLKHREADAYQRRHAMLEHLRIGPACAHALPPNGPAFGVCKKEDKYCDADQQQRPELRPWGFARARQQR